MFFSKKDDTIRVQELVNAVSDRLLAHIHENPHFWLTNASVAMVLLGVLKCGNGNYNYILVLYSYNL